MYPINCFFCPIYDDIIRVDAKMDSEYLSSMKRTNNPYFISSSGHKLYLDSFVVIDNPDPNEYCELSVSLSFSKIPTTYA